MGHDPLTRSERSHRMASVRSKDTKPELRVRQIVWALGYRYRLHPRDIAGRPDLVFRGARKLIFVHGCFWHQHHCAMGDRIPKSRVRFWRAKLRGNRVRDAKVYRRLKREGWSILTVWECETKRSRLLRLRERIEAFLVDTTQRAV